MLVIDPSALERIRPLFQKKPVFVFYPRPFKGEFLIYFNFDILCKTIFNLIKFGLKKTFLSYVLAIIDTFKIKIVIENIHYPVMVELAELRPTVKFITILNGPWLNWDQKVLGTELFHKIICKYLNKKKIKLSNYHIVMLGKKDLEIFKNEHLSTPKTGIKYHAIGSFIGFINQKIFRKIQKNKFDFCWISQVDSDTLRNPSHFGQLLKEETEKAFRFLKNYAKKRKKIILIHLRSHCHNSEIEKTFYLNLLDTYKRHKFSENKKRFFSVYKSAMQSKIICSLHSSVGFEAIGWNKKVAFFPLELSKIQKFSPKRFKSDTQLWPWLFKKISLYQYRKFYDLDNCSHKQYLKKMRPFSEYLISNKINSFQYLKKMLIVNHSPDSGSLL